MLATAITSKLSWIGRSLIDLVLPPQCLSCGSVVDDPHTLCAACWGRLRFIEHPLCSACGRPFDVEESDGALCGRCVRRPHVYARARSSLAYDDASRHMILMFKYADRTDAAPLFASWMGHAGRDLLAEAELIAPVPLHWTRLLRRRYNQAALLAQAIGRAAGIEVEVDLLRRQRRTARLAGMGAKDRARTVKGAISVPAARSERIKDRRVLLIDDVLTTGATVDACAQALLDAGASAVDVLTLARVVRPERI